MILNLFFLVSNSEIKRIVLPLKKHPEIKELRFFYKQIEALPERLIQGHYFEYIMLRAIKDVSKKYSPEKIAASEKIIKIISFSQFMIRPSNFLPGSFGLLSREIKFIFREIVQYLLFYLVLVLFLRNENKGRRQMLFVICQLLYISDQLKKLHVNMWFNKASVNIKHI
jgi:hypothetical protein